ncbi:hypothetical protein [Neolewinella agarilytica]|uniref:hypothetical protein n=1 Tax=Neolewinella agarilytica TaxID=478744 RepID=UPI002355C4AD|nr:hypothetical protein [Neolewinella agarilytica]
MSFQDPKPGRNRRKYKHGHRYYVKELLKSRGGEKYSEQRATRQAGKGRSRQRAERLGLATNHEPMRPRWGYAERQSFRMAPLLQILRQWVGKPWAEAKADIVGQFNLSNRTNYTAYRTLVEGVVWDENVDGPVSSYHLSKFGYYVAVGERCLHYRK